jgi:hypothetical protein
MEFATTMPSPAPLHLQPALSAQTEVEAVAVEVPAENNIRHGKPHEQQLIKKWIVQAQVPSWLKDAYDQWERDRQYLHTKVFKSDDPRAMTVNLAARAVQQKCTKISPNDADVSVRHERGVGCIADVRRDAIREANAIFKANGIPVQAQALVMAAEQAEQSFREELEAKERFAQTSEALVKKLWNEACGTETAQTFAMQAMTVGPAWLKIGWQRDYGRDSLGRSRNDDVQDQIALLTLRASEYANGQFTQDDPRFGELIRLSDYARQVGRSVASGETDPGKRIPFVAWKQIADTRDGEPAPAAWLPEPQVWQGATVDTVRPEALRWDWRVPFERWHESPWVMEQNLMDVDECAARYGLSPAERDLLGGKCQDIAEIRRGVNTPGTQGEQADPSRSTYEDTVQRGQVVVWERWDRQLHRHCIFVEGLDFFLLDESPRLKAPGFYPYVPIGFNTFDGAHLPLSDVTFLRKVQDAINQRLTDAEESLWASMKRYIVKKDAFKDGEIAKLRSAVPHDVIEVKSPEEIAKTFQEIASDDWNPNKYNLDQLFRLFELVSGMSISELGVVGQAEFATEAAIANASSQANNNRHANVMAKALTRAMTIIHHYAVTSYSEVVVKGMVGRAAYWPQPPTRMDLIRAMGIKVQAAGSSQAARSQAGTQFRDTISAVNGILDLRAKALMQGATFNADPLLTAAFRTIDTDTPVREILSFANAAPQMAGPTGGPPMRLPGPGAAPGVDPNAPQPAIPAGVGPQPQPMP